ncbi:MAG: glycosyltransferase family 4 protein [Patescibacteria group bacterium]|nr:glycosyltransferase family 4 protein [bacterium]MDZ4240508.1 glycosyltransferase family 4 protein [Patescibacteria group bacterium]
MKQGANTIKHFDGMKRILIFSLTYFPYVGGAEVAVKELTDRMGNNFEFDMITLRIDRALPAVEDIGNVRVHRIGFAGDAPNHSVIAFPFSINKYLFPFLAFFKALWMHAGKRYDAVWSIMAAYAGLAALFFKLVHFRIPFLLNLQEGDSVEHIHRRMNILLPLFRLIFKKADYIHAISHFLAAHAKSEGFSKTAEVIPNGVDVARFFKGYATIELAELRTRHNLPADEKTKFLITTSRLVPKNAVADTIRSLSFLPEYVHLLVVGDGPERNSLEILAKEKKIKGRTHFIGAVPYEEIPKYLSLGDIFVRPSISEGLGNSFLEAMAAGIPVIGTPVGGIVDFLFDPDANPDHEPTGLFCETRNPQSVASKVTRLLEDASLSGQISANAKNLVCDKYYWNGIAEDLTRGFQRTLS